MNILVAGGAGFIGINLVKKLVGIGDNVTVIDNFATASLENKNLLKNTNGVLLIEADITEPLDISAKFDAIVNLACPASPVDFGPKAIEILRVSSVGVFNLLELARKDNAIFLQASTSECYGDPLINPQNEDYWGNVNPIGPRSCYDEGKRFAESLTVNYHRRFGIKVKIARIFNTYGPYMRKDDGRVISNFITQALEDRPITVYGDGTQTRSFCYIDDLVDGLIKLLNTEYPYPINLGNPDEIKIIDLAKEIIELCESKSKIEFKPLPPDDPKVRRPDITRAKKLLHWEPKTARKVGLQKTIEYFKTLKLTNYNTGVCDE